MRELWQLHGMVGEWDLDLGLDLIYFRTIKYNSDYKTYNNKQVTKCTKHNPGITVVGSRIRSKDLNGLIKDLLLNNYETEINNIY